MVTVKLAGISEIFEANDAFRVDVQRSLTPLDYLGLGWVNIFWCSSRSLIVQIRDKIYTKDAFEFGSCMSLRLKLLSKNVIGCEEGAFALG